MPRWERLRACLPMLLVCLMGVSLAHGEPCLSPSPTARDGKNPYAPIADRDLTPAEQQVVIRLFKSLEGDWKGTAESFFCTSADDPSELESDHENLRAKVVVDYYGNLTLTAELYSPRKKTGRQENVHLYQSSRRLRIGHDNGAGDVELIEISEDKIAFLFRRILPTGVSGGSSRREHFFTLTADADTFSIAQQLYIQGRLSSAELLRFKR